MSEVEQTEGFAAEMPNAPVMTGENATPAAAENGKGKRAYKLQKDLTKYPGKVALIVLSGTKGEMIFDPSELPQNVKDMLPAFAIGHKLGDSAAGLAGAEAEEAISKVWEGLMKGDWAVRAPAAPKISLAELAGKFGDLSEEDKAAAAPLLKALGMKIPGITD